MAWRELRELSPVVWIPSVAESPVPEERRWTGGTSGNWPCGLLNWARNGASQQVWFHRGFDVAINGGWQKGLEVTHHAACSCVFRASRGPSRVLTKDWFHVTFGWGEKQKRIVVVVINWKSLCRTMPERHLNSMRFNNASSFDNVGAG